MAYSTIGGGQNVYIPGADGVSGMLQVELSRSPSSFAVNRYSTVMPVSKMDGRYVRLNSTEQIRVQSLAQYNWALGTDRPTGNYGQVDFKSYLTQRYGFTGRIPTETGAQASFDAIGYEARLQATKAMTARSVAAATALGTSGNWADQGFTNIYASWTALMNGAYTSGGGAIGTEGNAQAGFQAASLLIQQSSSGVINPFRDLVCVVNPYTAAYISQLTEVKSYVKNMVRSTEFLEGNGLFGNHWNLPPGFFGIREVVVEDAVKITSNQGATLAESYCIPNKVAVFVSRPGGLVQNAAQSSFSTLVNFVYEDMTVEQFSDAKNRYTEVSVVDNYAYAVAAPVTGIYVTDITA